MITLQVKSNRVGPIVGRHPWIFSQALVNIPEKLESGEPVVITDETGRYLASGYFNSYSQMAVRLWSFDKEEEVDQEFFNRRIKKANDLRAELLDPKKTNAYRLINAENDLLPGLIVDRYADYFVVQCHTKGIERWKDMIVTAIVEQFKPKGIYERSDVLVRRLEAAEKINQNLYGETPDLVKIKENGLQYYVDIKEGQKTGFFLDQRDKRAALAKYCKDKSVLNCFCYSGGFSISALGGGAAEVVSVDASASAIELARKNIELNKLDKADCKLFVDDVKHYLLRDEIKDHFDVIVLDPPAFIKDRHKIKEGIAGYKKINEMALLKIKDGGLLVTCSCSAHLSMTDFRYMLSEAGARTGRTLQIVESFTHGIDHPVLVPFTESEYLKVLFIKVIR